MTTKGKSFIKSAATTSQVSSSKAELERMLRRDGATGFAVQQQFDDTQLPVTASVQFVVPDKAGDTARVPVSLPIEIRRVYDALYGRPMKNGVWVSPEEAGKAWGHYVKVGDPKGYETKKLAQAERVAWRNLVLWIDAALSAASIGFQTITEAFFAHVVIKLDNGSTARMSEVVEAMQGQLPVGVRALLAAPVED